MPDKTEFSTLEMTGNIRVACPADLSLITPFVLLEQQDWFEDEIKFLRRAVTPESVVVDIGANYGLYTLALAKTCVQGSVWPYEPSADTARHLRASLLANNYTNVTLTQKALSNKTGTATLSTRESPELNALTEDAVAGEQVELATLDMEYAAYGWKGVDIVKIDAEGHELQVLDGGRNFFSANSPLVMCEIKAGKVTDLGPIQWLIGQGYQTFRLVPGLWALAPQDLSQSVDSYQLNIFCCKPDRAAELHARALLVADPAALDKQAIPPEGRWLKYTEHLPYAREYASIWNSAALTRPEKASDYVTALNYYALSQSPDISIDVRYGALLAAWRLLELLAQDSTNLSRLLSYTRVAVDLGKRQAAVDMLYKLVRMFEQTPNMIGEEPFLAPSPEFEHIPPQGRIANWTCAAILDSFEKLRMFSSYFSHPQQTANLVGYLKSLGFCSAQMEMRGKLAASRLSAMAN